MKTGELPTVIVKRLKLLETEARKMPTDALLARYERARLKYGAAVLANGEGKLDADILKFVELGFLTLRRERDSRAKTACAI